MQQPLGYAATWITQHCCYLLLVAVAFSCGEKAAHDACCTFTTITGHEHLADGQGMLQVDGSTSAYFYVLDEKGEQLGFEHLNKTLALNPGRYSVQVNNSVHDVTVREGELTTCSTGALMTSGNTTDYYYVMDSTGQQLGFEALGKAWSVFPGSYRVLVNNTEAGVRVGLRELTEIRTGTLTVTGTTQEYYYVLDGDDKQLNFQALGKPLAFFPGTYQLKVNNSSMTAGVSAGLASVIGTGTVLVKGLTEEYYYVTDTARNALNFQGLNKSLALFPGSYRINVNNTEVDAAVAEGGTAEFITGSLMLRGDGTQYYYVLDENGTQLNYNALNRSLSFFPAEYTVQLGSNIRKAMVAPGKLTTLDASSD